LKHISVTTFIHILFSIALAILVATLYYFVSISQEKNKVEDMQRNKFIAETLANSLHVSVPEAKLHKFFKELQLAGGAGIRFRVLPDDGLNLRFDFGMTNRGDNAIYLTLREAF